MHRWLRTFLLAGLASTAVVAACTAGENAGGTPEGTAYTPPSVALRRTAEGDTVTVRYRGLLEDGTVFDSSDIRGPYVFVLGSGQAVAGFDKGIRGLSVGQSSRFTVTAEEGYGPRRPEFVVDIPTSQAEPGLKAGDQIMLTEGWPATVLSVTPDIVRIDANHWLAGKTLIFEVVVQAIG
jgi:peptidylprolyl isomerase